VITVIALVLLPALSSILGGTKQSSGGDPIWQTVVITLAKVAAFVIIMLVASVRVSPGSSMGSKRPGPAN
jgi:CPA2 family monovalent cation:H+ antiporter-2